MEITYGLSVEGELRDGQLFKELTQEGGNRNWPVVRRRGGIRVRFFEKWVH
jgi:hypothetical protein